MTLKELKKMIAEEYAIYKRSIAEQALPTVAVSDADVDAEGGEDAEATLKDIYDMLKDYFEKDDAADDADDDATNNDADDDTDAMDEGHGMYDEDDKVKENKHLQERFQRLANIIKG